MANGALTEQVVEELEQVAVATRRIDGKVMGSFLIGVGIGFTVGFYIGYQYSKKKLRKDIFEEAEKEITTIREHYQQKTLAADAKEKPSIDVLVRERGYSSSEDKDVPARIEYAHLDDPTETRPTRPPVPVDPPKSTVKDIPTPIDPNAKVFRTDTAEKDKDKNWNYSIELMRRRPDTPYIIHQDEYHLNETGYTQTSYIYYAEDDVLVDENDVQIILMNRENLIGTEALNKFGHGADDYNLVHVRNSELQLEIVINRVEQSWEREVAGLDPDDVN